MKLQSDRLNRGWKDQPAHGTNKRRCRSQLAQVDDLLARTRCFKCGELGHLAKDCPQNKEPTTNSETFFSGMVYNNSCNVHPRNGVCADRCRDNSHSGVSRDDCAGVFRDDCAGVDSRNGLCVEGDFQRDDEFLSVRKDDVIFLDVQTDGVTLPVPGSSSSFSLGSVVVVGPRENRCRDVKLESGDGAEHNMSEPLVNSPETKRADGNCYCQWCLRPYCVQTVRKRLRIEARRQKELDGGVEPEVVLDRFLNQVKVEQQQQSGPLKRVLTPAAKAAKHRRARDKKLRETLCWWIANNKVCPDGDRCNFRHAVTQEKEQTVSGTGASWPGPATEQTVCETGVSWPGPSTNPTHPRSPTRDSWNNSWDRYDYRDKWTDVWKSDHDGNRWIHGWNEHYHDDNWADAWRERNPGYEQQHDDDNSTDAWSKFKSDDEWRASH